MQAAKRQVWWKSCAFAVGLWDYKGTPASRVICITTCMTALLIAGWSSECAFVHINAGVAFQR